MCTLIPLFARVSWNEPGIIVKKAKENGKIAGIHNGTTSYAKEMIDLGYQFLTVSSDFRSMSTHAQQIINDMKEYKTEGSSSTTY